MMIKLLAALSFLLTGCAGYKYNDDNIVEEAIELGIKYETGADIDLSPSTPETGFSPKAIEPISKE